MAAIPLTALFAAAAGLALVAIGHSWRRYGAAALALRHELRRCSDWQEVRITTRAVTVHPSGAVILRPDFNRRERRPAREHALPAAA